MPARLFHCEIRNAGDGPITCIHGILDHGDWSDGSRPWESANPIGPGEIKAFQSESSGVFTGTAGYATFTTLSGGLGDTHNDFIKISWDLPYFKLDSRDVDPAGVVNVETHRFDLDPVSEGSSVFVSNRDERPPAISVVWRASSTPIDFGEEIQNAPELFVGGVAEPFVAAFGGGVNVPDHVFCFINVVGSVAPDETPHTVPGFSHDRAVPPNAVPLTGSSPEHWAGTWGSDHVSATIGAAGHALEVTVQEQRQTGQHTIRGNGVSIQKAKLPPFAAREQAAGNVASRGHGSNRLTTGAGAVGTVAEHPSNSRIGVEEGTIFVGDNISLGEDASIEIYRLMSGNTMVGQALRYRRPTSHIVSVFGSFDEFLYRKVNIG